MRLFLLFIVLAFPITDLWVTASIAQWSGVPLWVLLTTSLLVGLLLLRSERLSFRRRTVATLHGEESLLRDLLDSGRKVLAGILLILPGLFSDLLALALLALPLNIARSFGPEPVAAGRGGGRGARHDSIDGDYRRID